MNRVLNTRPPTWFWAVSIAALLWSLVGVFFYIQETSLGPAELAALPEGQRILIETAPGWQHAAFALAVFASTLGSIGLLLRRMWSRILFIIALIAALAQFAWPFLMADAIGLLGASALGLPLAIIAIAIFLVWFAGLGVRRGWLR
ncbi:MAG: hypothetical protein H7X93_09960 [Sphingomonadaceae bacterium]|nr:hypothetical protein [Sphingomonadaceae bacterium]